MSVTKRILCLANSRKLQGRCVAGRELVNDSPGLWIRPVSDRPSEEVSEEERRYEDGSDPKVLDVIDIRLIGERPKDYQQENWLLDPLSYWVKKSTMSWSDLSDFADERGPLWINERSSYVGLNDRIPLDEARKLTSSLTLVYVEKMELRVFAPGEAFGNAKRRVQAKFSFDGADYWHWVTDPIIEREYLARADGTYTLKQCFLTISIGEPYQDFCYKLVATVIRRP